ncbi:MAG: DsrE/DsrF/DrsH-like family protein [Betaproteobacteria bacterium]
MAGAARGPDRLVIVVWSAGPDRPVLAAAPFVYALAGRAFEVEVEMHFTSTAVRWLVAGVADTAYTDAARTKTVADFIREAKAAGVRLYACSMAMNEHARDEALIPECDGYAGAATVVAAVMQGAKTLAF